jgi:hypothetical protein
MCPQKTVADSIIHCMSDTEKPHLDSHDHDSHDVEGPGRDTAGSH